MSGGSVGERVRALVAGRFPELAGVSPTVERAGVNRIYTFRGKVATSPDGPQLSQVVRVTVDGEGKVVRLVASR